MAKIMLGDYIVDPNDIYAVTQKDVRLGESQFTVILVKTRHEPKMVTIYNDPKVMQIANEYFNKVNGYFLRSMRDHETISRGILDMQVCLNCIGMTSSVNSWDNPNYLEENMEFAPKFKTKFDFFRKYLSDIV